MRPVLYSRSMKERLKDHDPYNDLDISNDRITRWHPLNQSLYVGYKVMLAGLLMIAKGDRIAMHSSVETRYPFLDEDVIQFCSQIAPEYKLRGMTEKWILRQVAAKTLPPQIANRPKTMFRAKLAGTFLGRTRPAWVDQLLSPESLRATGYFDAKAVNWQRTMQTMMPTVTPRRFIYDVGLTCVVSTQLWHHIYCGGGLCDLPSWEPRCGRRRRCLRWRWGSESPGPHGARPVWIPLVFAGLFLAGALGKTLGPERNLAEAAAGYAMALCLFEIWRLLRRSQRQTNQFITWLFENRDAIKAGLPNITGCRSTSKPS